MSDERKKRCYKCGDDRPVSEFWRDRSRRDGLYALCKTHASEKMREYWKGYYVKHRRDLIDAVKTRRKNAKMQKG